MVALKDAQLLTQKQDLKVFVALRAAAYGEQVKEQGDELSDKHESHSTVYYGKGRSVPCPVPGSCQRRSGIVPSGTRGPDVETAHYRLRAALLFPLPRMPQVLIHRVIVSIS